MLRQDKAHNSSLPVWASPLLPRVHCVSAFRINQTSPTEKAMAPTPVLLPGESQGQQSLVGCRLWGRTESDTTERLSSSSSSRPPQCHKYWLSQRDQFFIFYVSHITSQMITFLSEPFKGSPTTSLETAAVFGQLYVQCQGIASFKDGDWWAAEGSDNSGRGWAPPIGTS